MDQNDIRSNGSGDYIFISYSHRDSDRIHPLIRRLINDGYPVWYDEGIDPGTEWDENIAAHLQGCTGIIAFLSDNYLESDNCRDELNYARDLGKERLLVYLENVELPAGMAMRLNRLQAIHQYKYKKEDVFYSELTKAPMLQRCYTPPEAVSPAEVSEASASSAPIQTDENKADETGYVHNRPMSKREFLKIPEYKTLGILILITALSLYIVAGILIYFGDFIGCPLIIILVAIAQWRLNYLFVVPAAIISLLFGFLMVPFHFIICALAVVLILSLIKADILYSKYMSAVGSSTFKPSEGSKQAGRV